MLDLFAIVIRVPRRSGGGGGIDSTVLLLLVGIPFALLIGGGLLSTRYGNRWFTRLFWGLFLGLVVGFIGYVAGFEFRPRSLSFPNVKQPGGYFAGMNKRTEIPLPAKVSAVSENYVLENVQVDLVLYRAEPGGEVERRFEKIPASPTRYHIHKRWEAGPHEYISSSTTISDVSVQIHFPDDPALDGKKAALIVRGDMVYPMENKAERSIDEKRLPLDVTLPITFATKEERTNAEPYLKEYDDAFTAYYAQEDRVEEYEARLIPLCGAGALLLALLVVVLFRPRK